MAGPCGPALHEAFRFYESLFRGELDIRTHGDSPIADQVEPDWHDRVPPEPVETPPPVRGAPLYHLRFI